MTAPCLLALVWAVFDKWVSVESGDSVAGRDPPTSGKPGMDMVSSTLAQTFRNGNFIRLSNARGLCCMEFLGMMLLVKGIS